MDQTTIGARLRTLRRWRGLTQVELAGLAGLSPSFLSMVEHGQRMLDRRSHIAAIAAALRVSETDLTGGPHLSADPVQSDPHKAIPALRAALQTSTLTEPAVGHARPLPGLAHDVARLDRLCSGCDYAAAGGILPDVLDELHWHTARPADEAARRTALQLLVEACAGAEETARVLGYTDLAHLAALRAHEAAVAADDPVARGKAACLRLWAFPRDAMWDRKLAFAERAADALEPHAHTPLGTQVLGMLTLNAAMAAAVTQRPGSVTHWLGEAGRLADRVADDMTANWQKFSRTNVGLWRVAIGVERGEAGGTILELASGVRVDNIAFNSRRAPYFADVGRALARERRTRDAAVRWLRRAEDAAPQLIRNHPPTRETVAYLLGRAAATAAGRELRGMAARMNVPH
jgi:transcriptional regulator with XRE-family HTH domain